MIARRVFPLHPVCAECEVAPAVERHHWDGDATHNVVTNILPVCRRCHMRLDGRLNALKPRERQPLAVAAASALRRAQTHCVRGHPLAGDNLAFDPQGKRVCRACSAIHSRAYRARRNI
jgi:hypothetical protein